MNTWYVKHRKKILKMWRERKGKYILSSRSYIDQIIALRKEGKGISEIGRMLKKNHATILYWFRRIDALDPSFSYAPKHKREFTASDLLNKSAPSYYKKILISSKIRERQARCSHNIMLRNICYWCGISGNLV